MPVINKASVSLRIFGYDLDPDEVTRLLGKAPDGAERRGESVPVAPGRERIARQGGWRIGVESRSPGNLDDQIAELLAGTTEDLAVWQNIASAYNADIFCGLFLERGNEGVKISASTLAKLGDRGIDLDFDIYALNSS